MDDELETLDASVLFDVFDDAAVMLGGELVARMDAATARLDCRAFRRWEGELKSLWNDYLSAMDGDARRRAGLVGEWNARRRELEDGRGA